MYVYVFGKVCVCMSLSLLPKNLFVRPVFPATTMPLCIATHLSVAHQQLVASPPAPRYNQTCGSYHFAYANLTG